MTSALCSDDLRQVTSWRLGQQARRIMSKHPQRAAALLHELRRRRPDDPQLLRELASCLYRAEQLQQTHDVLVEALALVEDDPFCIALLVKALRRQGRSDEASEYYWRYLVPSQRPDVAASPGAHTPGNMTEARTAMDSPVEFGDPPAADKAGCRGE